MTPEAEITALKGRVSSLERILNSIYLGDRLIFPTKIELNRDVGTMFGLRPEEKIGFWGTLPVAQFSDPTGRADTSGSSGVAMTTGHRFNGNTGADYYSVGDIVYALKLAGILDNE